MATEGESHDLPDDMSRAEEKLRYALAAARMGTWEWDLQADRVEWSPETERIFGLEPGEFGGNYAAYAAFAAPEELEAINARVEQYLEAADDEVEIHYQHRIHRADGREAWIEVRGRLLKDAAGRPARLVGICADITSQVQSNQEKAVLERRLQQSQKLEAIGQLAGGIAHDFNNLLTAIAGNVEFALPVVAEGEPAMALREIADLVERAASLTRQLLAFGRRQVTRPSAVDVDQIIDTLSRLLGRLLPENIAIERRRGVGVRAAFADPVLVEQVVMNLVINARDALPRGGTIAIEVAETVLDETAVAISGDVKAGDYVVLTVRDTGRGMDAETLRRVFEPFFTTKQVGEGTGLGLATVYGIVKQSEGHITAESTPGRGTTFRVYLPIRDGATAAAPRAIASEVARGTETILLAEDDPQVRQFTRRVLVSGGYTVLVAEDGAGALARFREHCGSVHLLVTDAVMPDMNGKQLAARLRACQPDLPVLFISGYTANVIAQHGVLEAEVNLLEKPFDCRQLLARVRELLDQQP